MWSLLSYNKCRLSHACGTTFHLGFRMSEGSPWVKEPNLSISGLEIYYLQSIEQSSKKAKEKMANIFQPRKFWGNVHHALTIKAVWITKPWGPHYGIWNSSLSFLLLGCYTMSMRMIKNFTWSCFLKQCLICVFSSTLKYLHDCSFLCVW